MSDAVIDNRAKHRYELTVDDMTAIAVYQRNRGVVTFIHTEVPAGLQGTGIGSRLIKGALADVRRLGDHIIAQCSFVAGYLERHPEEQDLRV